MLRFDPSRFPVDSYVRSKSRSLLGVGRVVKIRNFDLLVQWTHAERCSYSKYQRPHSTMRLDDSYRFHLPDDLKKANPLEALAAQADA